MIEHLMISSNDGWQTVEFNLLDKVQTNTSKIFIFNLSIQSSYWNQIELVKGEVDDLVKDRILCFEQLCIKEGAWIKFLNLIESWKDSGTQFSCDLYNENGDFFKVKLSSDNDLILSAEKPSFEIQIKNSRLEMKSIMIVDQTSFSF